MKYGKQISLNDLNNDVLSIICDAVYELPLSSQRPRPLQSLSATSKRFRALAVPKLYSAIDIRCYGLEHAGAVLDTYLVHPELLQHVKSFRISIASTCEDDLPPTTAPSLDELVAQKLSRLLALQIKVSSICVDLPEEFADVFGAHCRAVNFKFPTIRTLVVGPYCSFLTAHCPNTLTFATVGWLPLRKTLRPRGIHADGVNDVTHKILCAAGSLPELQCFEVHAAWASLNLHVMCDNYLHISRLCVVGPILKSRITKLQPMLAQLPRLEEFVLGRESLLRILFRSRWSGEVFKGPKDDAMSSRQMPAHKPDGVLDSVAKTVFGANASIKNVLLHEGSLYARASVQRDADGKLQSWQWSHTWVWRPPTWGT